MPPHDLDQLSIQSSSTPEGFRLITLKGWITAKNTPALEDAIHQARGLNTVLDLSEVPYMDSSGLRLLIELHDRAQAEAWELTLLAPKHESAAVVLRVTGADSALPFEHRADS